MKKIFKISILLSSFVAFMFLPSSFAFAATKSKAPESKNVKSVTQSTDKNFNKPKNESKKQPDKNQTVKATFATTVASQSKPTKSSKVSQNKESTKTQKMKNSSETKPPVKESAKNEKESKETNSDKDSSKEKVDSKSGSNEKNNLKLVIDEKSNNSTDNFDSIQKENSNSGMFDDLEFVKILGIVLICACVSGMAIFIYLLSKKKPNKPEIKKSKSKERYRGAHFKN